MKKVKSKSELKELIDSLLPEEGNAETSTADDKSSTMMDFRKGSNMELILSDLKNFASIQTQYLKTIASGQLKNKPDAKPTPIPNAGASATVEEVDNSSGSGFRDFSTILATSLASNMMGPLGKFIVPLLSLGSGRDKQKKTKTSEVSTVEDGVSTSSEIEKSAKTSDASILSEPTASIRVDYEQGSNLESALNSLKEYGKQTNDYLKSMVDFNTRMENAARENSVDDATESKRTALPTRTVISDGKQVETPAAGGGMGVGDILGAGAGLLGLGASLKGMFKGAKRLLGFGGKTAETAAKTEAKVGAEAGEKAAFAGAKELVESGAEKGTESVGKSVGRELVTEGVETAGKKGGVKAIGKIVAEVVGAKAGKIIAKAIPGVGAIAGLGFGIWRLTSGDWNGAALEVAGGAASMFPGVGTAAAIATDVGLLARDVYQIAYGTFPEVDPLAGERLGEITDAVTAYVESMVTGEESTPKEGESAPTPAPVSPPQATGRTLPNAVPPPSDGTKTPPVQGFKAQMLTGQNIKPVPPVTPDLATSELDDDTTGLDLMDDFAKRMGLTEEIKSGKMQGGVPIEINGVPVPKDLYTPEQLKMVNDAPKPSDMMNGGETTVPITEDNSFDAQFQAQLQDKKDAMSGDNTPTPNTDAFVPFDKPNPKVTYKAKGGGFVNDEDASPADRARMRGNKYVAPTFNAPTVAEKSSTPPVPIIIAPQSDSKGSAAPVVNNSSTTHVNVTKDPSHDLMFNQMLGGF